MINETYISVLKKEITELAFNLYMTKYYRDAAHKKMYSLQKQDINLEKEYDLLCEQCMAMDSLAMVLTKILQHEKDKNTSNNRSIDEEKRLKYILEKENYYKIKENK